MAGPKTAEGKHYSKTLKTQPQADMSRQTEEEAAKMLGQMKVLLVGNQGSLNRFMRLKWHTNVQIQILKLPVLSRYLTSSIQ